MNHKKLFSGLLALFIIISVFTSFAFAQEMDPPPELKATAAVLMELNSGETLFELNPTEKVYPASLTKIMTCMLVLEQANLSDTVTVSETALENLDIAGSTAGLVPGEAMSVEHLLYCMMLSSANEACNVAAEYVSGSVDAFIQKMNEKAAALGCTGTHFANTHGLHNEDHYTTARDLSIIAKEAIKSRTFRTIVSTPAYTVPATNLSPARELYTTNKLIVPGGQNIYYDRRVTGVKTGFTTPAGRCLAATAEDGELNLLSIVCGCDTIILETGDLAFGSFPETLKLLDYGFDNFRYETVLTSLYPVAEIPVSRSAGANFVSLAPGKEITALIPVDFNKEELKLETTLTSNEGVSAPIAAGDELGTATLSYNGKVLGTVPLVAITSVERATLLTYLNPARYASQAWLRIVLLIIIGLCLLVLLFSAIKKRAKKKQEAQSRRMRKIQEETKETFGSNDWYKRK